MLKKTFWILLPIVIFLLFIVCVFGDEYAYMLNGRRSLDEKLHNKIESVWKGNDPCYIIYEDQKYNYVGTTNLFIVDRDANNYFRGYDDVLLSWNGYRYVGVIVGYYSCTADNPIYIYESVYGYVYFREDYDYTKDTYVIGDTVMEIAWEDIFASKIEQTSEWHNKVDTVFLKSKQDPRIQVRIELECVNGKWCMILEDIYSSRGVATPSDEFLKILFENGLIQQGNETTD